MLTEEEFRAHAHGPLDLPEFAAEIFLVNNTLAAVVRAGWVKESFSKAWNKAIAEDWTDAYRYIDLAHTMKGGFDLAIFPLLVIAAERSYGKERADWEVSSARNSLGKEHEFIAEFQERKKQVAKALAAKKPFSTR